MASTINKTIPVAGSDVDAVEIRNNFVAAATDIEALQTSVAAVDAAKVDKVTGKGLSENDYTTAEKSKLAGIEAGAQVNTVTPSNTATLTNKTISGASNTITAIAQSSVINLTTDLAGKEPTITAGTTAQYYRGDKTFQTLNTTSVAEGTNLYHTAARVLASVLTGLSTATNSAVLATDTILVGIGKLQAQITAALTDIATRAGLGLNNIFTGRNRFAATIGTWQTETFATTQALDATKPFAVLTLTANVTFDSVTGAGAAGEAQVLYREVKQDATGSRTASYNTTNFEKVGAAFPVLSTAANARDFLTFTRSQNGKWLVTAGLNIS